MDGVLVIMNGKLKKWAPRRNLTEPARVRIPFIRLSVYIFRATIYTLMLINQIDAKYAIFNQIFLICQIAPTNLTSQRRSNYDRT
jgi:hypothetical protein